MCIKLTVIQAALCAGTISLKRLSSEAQSIVYRPREGGKDDTLQTESFSFFAKIYTSPDCSTLSLPTFLGSSWNTTAKMMLEGV